jgi:hypothetical protein
MRVICEALTPALGARVVVDVGVGSSTLYLAEKGSGYVVGVDVDPSSFEGLDESARLDLVVADASFLPLRDKAARLVVFYFTLHEVDPRLHVVVLSEARRAACSVLVVEPLPYGARLYEEYALLWRGAMHSIGRFEDYMPAEYWAEAVEKAGFRVERLGFVEWKAYMPPELFRGHIEAVAREWEEMGVSSAIVERLRRLLGETRKTLFKWSDLVVVVGRAC